EASCEQNLVSYSPTPDPAGRCAGRSAPTSSRRGSDHLKDSIMKTSVLLSSSISLGVPSRRPGLTLPLLFVTVAMLLLLLSITSSTFADSATWKTNPGSG